MDSQLLNLKEISIAKVSPEVMARQQSDQEGYRL